MRTATWRGSPTPPLRRAVSWIDTELFRTTGEVALDDMLAPSLAGGLIVAQPNGGDLLGAPVIAVAPDGRSITVTLSLQC